jgi:uncharacterized protein (DUF58 family)
MTMVAAPKLAAYSGLAAAGLTAALLLGRPEIAALALPFILVLVVGLATGTRPQLGVQAALDRDRVVQGEEVSLDLAIHAQNAVDRARIVASVPHGLTSAVAGDALELGLDAGERRQVTVPLVAGRWGGYALGALDVEARDALGLFRFVGSVAIDLPLRVFPRPHAVSRAVAPLETRLLGGDATSRHAGEGIEFAGVRPFVPGDRVRRVNWRISSRERSLHVNDLHPERSRDVVLLLDTFAAAAQGDAQDDTQDDALDLAVQAAWTVAAHYLRGRDRVGLVGFGGTLRWLTPDLGEAQRYRIAEALIDTQVALSYAWKDIGVIPPRTLPPRALVLALTPLLDPRVVGALFDLRARRFDVAVLEVSPDPFLPPPRTPAAELARRLWRLERESLRHDLRRLGVAVGSWSRGEPLAAAIEEVEAFRRFARRVPA